MLTPVDRVEVTVVIDNFLDVLMAGKDGVTRYQGRDFGSAEQLIAEHGFSALKAAPVTHPCWSDRMNDRLLVRLLDDPQHPAGTNPEPGPEPPA